jgi:hypothetical protein
MGALCKLISDFNKLAKTIDITMQIRLNPSLFLADFSALSMTVRG